MDDRSQLDEELRTLEALAREYDAGDAATVPGIAEGLRRIFQGSPSPPSILSRLSATYTRVASSVPRALSPTPGSCHSCG